MKRIIRQRFHCSFHGDFQAGFQLTISRQHFSKPCSGDVDASLQVRCRIVAKLDWEGIADPLLAVRGAYCIRSLSLSLSLSRFLFFFSVQVPAPTYVPLFPFPFTRLITPSIT